MVNALFKDGLIGFAGIALSTISSEQVTGWISLACTLAITITTCGIQVYRMIRDRDSDKEKDKKQDEEKED